MMKTRRIAGGFAVAYGLSWVAALICAKVLDLGQTAGLIVIALAALVGGWIGWTQTESLVEWSAGERRDAIIGWGVVIAIIGAVLSGFVPMPWTILAALAWVILVAIVCRALLASSAPERAPASPESS